MLEQDKDAGERCKEAAKTDRVVALRTYVQALRRIDLRPCPPDFQEAFLKHRYAWEEIVPFLEKYDGFTGDLISLFELGSGIINNQSLTTEGDREFGRIRKAISATYRGGRNHRGARPSFRRGWQTPVPAQVMPRIPSRAVGALGAAQPGSLDAKRLPDYPDPVSEARQFGAIDGMYYSAKATEDKPPAPGRRNRNWFGAFAKQSSPTAKGKD